MLHRYMDKRRFSHAVVFRLFRFAILSIVLGCANNSSLYAQGARSRHLCASGGFGTSLSRLSIYGLCLSSLYAAKITNLRRNDWAFSNWILKGIVHILRTSPPSSLIGQPCSVWVLFPCHLDKRFEHLLVLRSQMGLTKNGSVIDTYDLRNFHVTWKSNCAVTQPYESCPSRAVCRDVKIRFNAFQSRYATLSMLLSVNLVHGFAGVLVDLD